MTTETQKLRLQFTHEGAVARLILSAPKANIVDFAMLEDLDRSMDVLAKRQGLKAIVLMAEGPHFSFGASIEEHLPDVIGPTLHKLHSIIRRMNSLAAPTIAAIQGQCLGGGLELALACDLLLAEEGAQFGCPEIQLGVFAPAASALLPLRIRGGDAALLLLTGTRWDAEVALQKGLVDRIAPKQQLEATLNEWLQHDFLPRSANGLRCASMAIRHARKTALDNDLVRHESLYLRVLMASADGSEGIRAFLERRAPVWRNEVTDES